jgi:hypothetical protein
MKKEQFTQSGQLIKATIDNMPFIYHYGIALVHNNEVYVLHNTPFRGSVIDTFNNWIKGRNIIEVSQTDLIGKENNYILAQFDTACRKKYNLFNFNCEQFIDCMLRQQQKSEQLAKWSLIGVGILALTLTKF